MATILIVEDDVQVSVLAQALLRADGHATVTAANLPQAVALIESSDHFDLIFTDIGLGSDTDGGIKVAEAARAKFPNVAVIYTTGGAVTDGLKALMVEGSQLILKPYLPEQITTMISLAAYSRPERPNRARE